MSQILHSAGGKLTLSYLTKTTFFDLINILVQGPMWREIRGPGLTYSYGIRINPSEGLMYLLFFKSTNVVGAFAEAKKIIVIFDLFYSMKKFLIFFFVNNHRRLNCTI